MTDEQGWRAVAKSHADHLRTVAKELSDQLRQADDKLAVARKALAFYADEASWREPSYGGPAETELDGGRIAFDALAAMEAAP